MYKQVKCVSTLDPYNHENIYQLGGDAWREPKATVIANIDANRDTYYTVSPEGVVAVVGVVRESGKQPYVRTYADGKYTNNLLSLQSCSLY